MSVPEDAPISMDQDAPKSTSAPSKKPDIDPVKVEEGIANARALAAQGSREEAINALLSIEQKGRLAEDVAITRSACTAILEIVHAAQDWTGLQDTLLLLSKRRSQLRQVITAIVRQVMGYVDDTPDLQTKTALIKTLQDLTEGKMYVEIERARLTRRLAQMTEEAGKVSEAADILQEVAVETFGTMAKTEKIAYILEQVRLCLDKEDFARAQILSKKISPRTFVPRAEAKKGEGTGEIGIEGTAIEAAEPGTPSLEELKKQYYALMIRYHAHSGDYLEICRAYRAVYEDGDTETLEKMCWYAVLAPADSDQITLAANTAAEPGLSRLPKYKDLLQRFNTKEILWWQLFTADFKAELEAADGIFGGSKGAKLREDLKLRVVEHNLVVLSTYYSSITMQRLTQLLDLTTDEAEARLSEMVVAKKLEARLDRPAGTIRFVKGNGSPSATLSAWTANIARLLETVERTCQQIQKESMVHRVPIGAQ
ncbi:hypothetical protein ACKKBG_A38220 [Auxenochlorella protothecoides x Auxenochlorella symbiontica]